MTVVWALCCPRRARPESKLRRISQRCLCVAEAHGAPNPRPRRAPHSLPREGPLPSRRPRDAPRRAAARPLPAIPPSSGLAPASPASLDARFRSSPSDATTSAPRALPPLPQSPRRAPLRVPLRRRPGPRAARRDPAGPVRAPGAPRPGALRRVARNQQQLRPRRRPGEAAPFASRPLPPPRSSEGAPEGPPESLRRENGVWRREALEEEEG